MFASLFDGNAGGACKLHVCATWRKGAHVCPLPQTWPSQKSASARIAEGWVQGSVEEAGAKRMCLRLILVPSTCDQFGLPRN